MTVRYLHIYNPEQCIPGISTHGGGGGGVCMRMRVLYTDHNSYSVYIK